MFLYTVSDFGAVDLMRYGTLTREIFARRLDPSSALPLYALYEIAILVSSRIEKKRLTRAKFDLT